MASTEPYRLTSMTSRQSASVSSSKLFQCTIPAAFTQDVDAAVLAPGPVRDVHHGRAGVDVDPFEGAAAALLGV